MASSGDSTESLALRCWEKLMQAGGFLVQKIWRTYWNTTTLFLGSSRHRKRSDDWSDSNIPTCRKVTDVGRDVTWLLLEAKKYINQINQVWSRSGPVSKDLFNEAPWNFAAPLSTLCTLPALLGFKTGCFYSFHSFSDRFSTLWAFGISIIDPIIKEVFIWEFGVDCCPQLSDIVSQAIVYGGNLKDFACPWVCCRSWVEVFVARNGSMSYREFNWLVNSLSGSIFILRF